MKRLALIALTVTATMLGSSAAWAATSTPRPSASSAARTATKVEAARKAEATRKAAVAKRMRQQLAAGQFVTVDVRDRVLMPAWTGATIDGVAWSTASLRGRVHVVNLWASWCSGCRDEWDTLQAMASRFPTVSFVGVDTLDSEEAAKAWLEVHPTSYPHVFDQRAVIMNSFTTVANRALPITVVVDARGRISAWKSGPILAAQLERVLK